MTFLPRYSSAQTKAFTLIELLVAIAVVGILAAILIPVVGGVRESAHTSVCASNLRQLSSAAKLYANENSGQLLSMPTAREDGGGFDENQYWFRQIYPYLKEDREEKTTQVFQCPADPEAVEAFASGGYEWSTISYLLLRSDPDWRTIYEIDEPSKSPLFIDAVQVATNNYRSDEMLAQQVKGNADGWRHGDGVNVAYWDGSVQFVQNPSFYSVFKDLEGSR